jgi:hypothetical protein
MTSERVWWCQDCCRIGLAHCSDPIHCGGMRSIPYEEARQRYAALAKARNEQVKQ